MAFLKKRDAEGDDRPEVYDRAARRLSALPTADVVLQAELTMASMGRNLAEWQRDPDNVAALAECELGAQVLTVAVRELLQRVD